MRVGARNSPSDRRPEEARETGSDVTRLLAAVRAGDDSSRARLFAVVYDELHTIVRARMAGIPATDTLQATALVHEAWLKLSGREGGARDRRHFVAIAARAMRDVVVDQARRHASAKRGGELRRVTLSAGELEVHRSALDVLEVNDLLERLQEIDPMAAQVVTLRFFGGLAIDEIALSLGTSASTVDRSWAFARAWIAKRLSTEND